MKAARDQKAGGDRKHGPWRGARTPLRWALGALIAALVVLLAMQAVPYGRNHSNPQTRVEPAWDSVQTQQLVRRACYDCHSNETVWPWYASIAPTSWLLQRSVDGGRSALNFSEWARPQDEAGEAAETVQEGEMPPWRYTILHPEAVLSSDEKQALIKGLETTLGPGESGDDTD